MKFVIIVEEDGYQFRYWNELTEGIGESIATSWDKNTLYKTLENQGFNIDKHEFDKAIKLIDEGKSFIVLHSNGDTTLDSYLKSIFYIDESLTNGNE